VTRLEADKEQGKAERAKAGGVLAEVERQLQQRSEKLAAHAKELAMQQRALGESREQVYIKRTTIENTYVTL
jgi:hypothetical protein